MSSQPRAGGRSRRRRGGAFNPQRSAPSPANRPLQRVWKCPACGRTRPGAAADARPPLCRHDLAEMRIALAPAVASPNRSFRRGR